MNPLESEEQAVLVQWLRVNGLRHHHSPNATGHTIEARRRAIRMKQQGTSAGFPDLIVLIPPSRSITGEGFLLCIELKRRKGGVVSPEQRVWIDALNGLEARSVAAYVCRGASEAIDIISKHMKLPTNSSPF